MGPTLTWALPALVCVVVVVLAGVACQDWHQVDPTVCRYRPLNSQRPTSVKCDLQGDSIYITGANLPQSIRELQISNASEVEVRAEALTRLERLNSIRFTNVSRSLTIQSNTMIPAERVGTVSLTIDRVRYVLLNTSAFSYLQHDSLNASITNIETCTINGASIVSNSETTSVLLENIKYAQVYSGTFATTIGKLIIRNVNMTYPCYKNTFSGRIGSLSLISMKLNSMNSGCLRANHLWRSLVIQSSHVGDIHAQGLQGMIANVLIEGSDIGNIATHGLHLTVSLFSMKECSIHGLAEDALNVRASESISLQMSNITTLRENAFGGLQANNSGQGIELGHLTVGHAYNGCLRFAQVNVVTLRQLLIRIPCICNIRKQASQLVFGRRKGADTMTKQEKRKLFRSVFRNTRCLDNATTPTLLEYRCQRCHGRNDRTDRLCSAPERPGVQSWVPYVSASAVLLMVAAGVTLLVVRRRRLAQNRGSGVPKRRPHSQITAEDIVHVGSEYGQLISPMSSTTVGDQHSSHCEALQPARPRTNAESAIYAEIPDGPTSGEEPQALGHESWPSMEQPLYEEVPGYEKAREGLEAGQQTEPKTDLPMYAQVNKGTRTAAKASETGRQIGPTAGFTVYAEVNKSKPNTNNSEMGQDSESTTELPVYAQVNKNKTNDRNCAKGQQSGITTELPLYAQVIKNKTKDKACETGQQPGGQESGPASEIPIYAQVNKDKLPAKNSETDHSEATTDIPVYAEVNQSKTNTYHSGTGQQSEPTTEDPVYAEVSKSATTTKPSEGSPRDGAWSTMALRQRGPQQRTTPDAAAVSPQTEPIPERPEYAEASRDTAAETKPEAVGQSDPLTDNELYGLPM